EALMNDVLKLVVDKYDGSLKAEHGTGRNMAPFVKYEWGETAYEVMKAVKQLFDPKNLLNPGVIFNDDPQCHIKNFKPLPLTNPHVDKCIECGFCEVNCLACGFTLSSRQRIVLQREISHLKVSGEDTRRLRILQKQYRYSGNQTCAGDGLCSMSCPMEINTGDLTHDLRQANQPKGSIGYRIGNFTVNHFAGIKNCLRLMLSLAHAAHTVLGTKIMSAVTKGLHCILNIPLWTAAMPKGFNCFIPLTSPKDNSLDKAFVVYFPSCINQTMGVAKHSPEATPLVNKMLSLLQKAGYQVIFPKDMDKLCCGTIWESKGMPDIADRKAAELEAALYEASEQGKYPVLCDQSPCLYRMCHTIKKLKLYEPAEFICTFLLDKLEFIQTNTPIAVHITCSMR
ncbi:putative FAD-linked oxidoreductase, partial [termite gut metagenome]